MSSTTDGMKCPGCHSIYPKPDFEFVPKGQANQRRFNTAGGGKTKCSSKEAENDGENKLRIESEPETPPKGRLNAIAAKVIMKVMYAARLARFDLLRAVCNLARFLTK